MFSGIFQSLLGRATLFTSDDTWALLAIMCVSVAAAIYLEQTYQWASKISGVMIALILALLLSNLSIIPTSCTLYDDIIWGFAVPLGIPLLLLQCNIKRIWKETGRMLILFVIGAVGTMIGTFVAYSLLHNAIPELEGIAAMMTGTYIGGSINLAALASEFDVGDMTGAAIVADNLLMALYFFALIAFAGMHFFRSHFSHPHIEEVETNGGDSQTLAASFWSRKEISLKDIAFNFAYAATIVWLSRLIGSGIAACIPVEEGSYGIAYMLNGFFGSQYVWMTTLGMLVATFAQDKVEKLNGAQEIGTFLIYLFLFVIGVPASIVMILTEVPLLLVFTGLIVAFNMVFCFVGGKLLGFDLEDIILASNANIGGPTTAAGMAISQGWTKLVAPVMLIGTFGYVLGTYCGMIVGALLGA